MVNESVGKELTLRNAKTLNQLIECNTELTQKTHLFRTMRDNNSNKLEANMNQLTTRIDLLEKEKIDLITMVRNGGGTKASERLKKLETECSELKKQEKDFKRMLAKTKEENERHCERLRDEIQHLKREQVKLTKQMTTGKEKELTQLKENERRREAQIRKLQEGNTRHECLLRSKNAEISRIQRQVADISEKQKQMHEKRLQAFENKSSSSQGDRLRAWITQEIEVSACLAEAHFNVDKLIKERLETAKELDQLKQELAVMKPSINTTFVVQNEDGDKENSLYISELEKKIERIRAEIEFKNVQIKKLQQTVFEGDQGTSQKTQSSC